MSGYCDHGSKATRNRETQRRTCGLLLGQNQRAVRRIAVGRGQLLHQDLRGLCDLVVLYVAAQRRGGELLLERLDICRAVSAMKNPKRAMQAAGPVLPNLARVTEYLPRAKYNASAADPTSAAVMARLCCVTNSMLVCRRLAARKM